MKKIPKILFLNINFRYDNSAGLTISKLVNCLPKKNLGLLSIYSEISNIDIIGYKYQITKHETNVKIQVGNNNNRKNKTELHPPKTSYKLIKFFKTVFKNIIGNNIKRQKYHISEKLKTWLINFSPDYIYLNPDNTETIKFALQLSEFLGCKIIIHVMDDKVNKHYQGVLGYFDKKRFISVFLAVVIRADVCLSISEKMATEYKKRYHKKFNAFHNPINAKDWNKYIKTDWNLTKEIKIVYSGFIGSTAKPILEFCRVIENLNKEVFNIKFVLYSKFNDYNIIKKLRVYSFVEINSYVEQSKLPKVLTSADFLFLPLSFEKDTKFTKLSMPTKTAEYMISGVPVIVYAPKKTALAEYAKEGNWAYVVSANKSNNLKFALIKLINEKQVRVNIANNAVNLARKNHDILQSQEKFMNILMPNI